jgi:hypothetical protein
MLIAIALAAVWFFALSDENMSEVMGVIFVFMVFLWAFG